MRDSLLVFASVWTGLILSVDMRKSIFYASWQKSDLLSLRVFGLLSSSLLLFSQRFGRYVLRPSSGVRRTQEPTRNFELRSLLNPRRSPVLIPLAITGYKYSCIVICLQSGLNLQPQDVVVSDLLTVLKLTIVIICILNSFLNSDIDIYKLLLVSWATRGLPFQ